MKKLPFLLLLAPTLNCFAQQNHADSLRIALKTAKTDSARVSLMADLSGYYAETKRDSSIYYSDQCLAIAKKNDKALNEADFLDAKGYELMHLRKYPESLQCLEQAQNLAEDPANENKLWLLTDFRLQTPHKARLTILASIHHDRGHLMGSTNNIDQQIIEYRETKKLAEKAGIKDLIGLVDMNLGSVYFKLNRLDSALVLGENAERIFKQMRFKKYLGFVYEDLADIYAKRGNKALELQYYHNGIKSGLEQNNLSVVGYAYEALSNYYLTSKQPDSSLFYAKKTLAVGQTMDSKDLGLAYESIYKSFELRSQIDSAYKYQGLALIAKDSNYKATVKSLTDFEKLSFKDQLRLRDLEKEKAAIQTKIRTYILLSAIGVLMLLAIIFYRNNRQKQKANHLLHEQKEEIATQRDSLEQTLNELKTTQTQLVQREKMASLGELTAGIAHEIQNPLNFVNNFSEVNEEMLEELKAESRKPKAERNEQLETELINDLIDNQKKIKHHGKRADFIVKGMLEHSRTNTGEKQLTDMNVLCDEFLKLSYHGLRSKDKNFNAELITHFDEHLSKVNVSQQDIGRVMLNLFNNAFYAVNEKRKTAEANYKPGVTVTTFTPPSADGGWGVSVLDNGNGIPDSIKDKIMQPFFTTKPTGEGTGLGLSLSYDIVVKGHGGNITVDTKEGEFTKFIVTLP